MCRKKFISPLFSKYSVNILLQRSVRVIIPICHDYNVLSNLIFFRKHVIATARDDLQRRLYSW